MIQIAPSYNRLKVTAYNRYRSVRRPEDGQCMQNGLILTEDLLETKSSVLCRLGSLKASLGSDEDEMMHVLDL